MVTMFPSSPFTWRIRLRKVDFPTPMLPSMAMLLPVSSGTAWLRPRLSFSGELGRLKTLLGDFMVAAEPVPVVENRDLRMRAASWPRTRPRLTAAEPAPARPALLLFAASWPIARRLMTFSSLTVELLLGLGRPSVRLVLSSELLKSRFDMSAIILQASTTCSPSLASLGRARGSLLCVVLSTSGQERYWPSGLALQQVACAARLVSRIWLSRERVQAGTLVWLRNQLSCGCKTPSTRRMAPSLATISIYDDESL
mmetsp:Transcript_4281/g.12970  ORF Transcript_4281/g.12970 Transcript_4281/m.12970 type:complete len:255 (-) Transcript_4281:113-877(-)